MKKHTLFVATLALAMGAWASVPYQALPLPKGSHHPVISPDGSKLLFSTEIHTGLKVLNFADGEISVLDDAAAAGFQPVFSTDCKTVYYRTAEMIDGLMYRDVRSYTFSEGTPRRVAAPSREKVDLPSMAGGDYAVADYQTVKVVRSGKVLELNPLPQSHSYLWASLSADGERLLFTEPFMGVFVANADGSDARCVTKKGDYASWAGKNKIVAVVSTDDGYQLTESKLVLFDLSNNTSENLTPDAMLVSEATASADGKVVFTDIEGNMFTLNINER